MMWEEINTITRTLVVSYILCLVPYGYLSRNCVAATQQTIDQSMGRIASAHALVRLFCLLILCDIALLIFVWSLRASI